MITLTAKDVLPEDGTRGTLVGRVFLPAAGGPAVVVIRDDGVFDVSSSFPTISARCEADDPARQVRRKLLAPVKTLRAIRRRERDAHHIAGGDHQRTGGRPVAQVGAVINLVLIGLLTTFPWLAP